MRTWKLDIAWHHREDCNSMVCWDTLSDVVKELFELSRESNCEVTRVVLSDDNYEMLPTGESKKFFRLDVASPFDTRDFLIIVEWLRVQYDLEITTDVY